jgi:gamma-aminobutyric acid type B receptor
MTEGKYNLLGYYDTQTDNLTWLSHEKWVGGKPPPDHTIIVKQLIVVSKSFFITLNVISGIGVIWALGLLVFNFRFKNFRYIQMSHPVTNNIMLIGFIICLSSIVLFGLDGQKISIRYFSGVCHARAAFLSIGFSLSFGAMFTKIWISYRISTHMEHHGKQKVTNTNPNCLN